jgi:hypothetical protein
MEPTGVSAGHRPVPTVLVSAVVQGAALYALHLSIKNHHWPATDQAWLLALYALFVFMPIAVQMLVAHLRNHLTWLLLLVWSAAYAGFGFYHGSTVLGAVPAAGTEFGLSFPVAFELLLLWLLVLPFIQIRLANGAWNPPYRQLFSLAWRNKLTLAEAGLFTTLFWGLLLLWQQLFHVLGIDFFRELFKEPIFVYPVTALAFGFSLHLIGSLSRWVDVVLEQLLGVLKWLGVLAAAILALFTIALLVKLRLLVFSGERAIGSAWLLALVSVVVLFVNAAFRDGSMDDPYPRTIGNALRLIMGLTIVVAAVAAYSLSLRLRLYGLTVERFWGLVVTAFAIIYAVGYTAAAARSGPWMAGIARVNVIAALGLIIVIAAALTPLSTPYRLAADSQYRMALRWQPRAGNPPAVFQTPFQYLRFSTGSFGTRRLAQLAHLQGEGSLAAIREQAVAAQNQSNRFAAGPVADSTQQLASMTVYPSGRSVPEELRTALEVDLRTGQRYYRGNLLGLYIDLNGTHEDVFVLFEGSSAQVYQQRGARWTVVGSLFGWGGAIANDAELGRHLADGDYAAMPQTWYDLKVGNRVFRFTPKSQ